MKKSLIATGAASLALAAMPVVGAFAAGTVTDTVILTIQGSCSVGGAAGSSSNTGKTIEEPNAVNNHLYTYDATAASGGTLKVSCNASNGWNVKAVGAGTGSSVTNMDATGSGTEIATGTTFSGGTSAWGFKLASGGTGVTVADGYGTFTAVPGTATKVASGTAAISEGTIYTGYQVWVSATQQADTYTGKVTYTIAEGTS